MDRRFFIRLIEQNLEDISGQFDLIRKHEGKIPQIELDIIMHNLRTIYEYFHQLKKVNDGEKVEEPGPKIPSAMKKEAVIKEEDSPREDVPEEKPVDIPDIADDEHSKETGQEMNAEPPAEEETIPVEPVKAEKKEDTGSAEVRKEPPAQDKEEVKKSTADLFSNGSNTLADKLKSSDEMRVADKINKASVKQLRSAIGINEKFLLINELFNGKMKDYEHAIEKLDNCASLDESSKVLSNFKDEYQWNQESEAYQTFDNLLKRKFF